MPDPTPLPPHKLYRQALQALRRSRADMLSLEFSRAIERASEPEQKAAADTLLNINLTIHKLENAALADIRDQLKANEKDLTAATQEAKDAARELSKVKKYVEAAAKVLGVVAKVVGKVI